MGFHGATLAHRIAILGRIVEASRIQEYGRTKEACRGLYVIWVYVGVYVGYLGVYTSTSTMIAKPNANCLVTSVHEKTSLGMR